MVEYGVEQLLSLQHAGLVYAIFNHESIRATYTMKYHSLDIERML
jgi:hypothetical protein